jgi:hypothetical protein
MKTYLLTPNQSLMCETTLNKQLSEQVIADSVTMFVNFYQS